MNHISAEQVKSKFVVHDGTPQTIVHGNMEEEDFMEDDELMDEDDEFMEKDFTEGQEQLQWEDSQKAVRCQYHYIVQC